jgi:hypothetical protein
MTTLYHYIDEEVYFILNDKIHKARIEGIYLNKNINGEMKIIYYLSKHECIEFTDNDIYSSLESIIEYMTDTLIDDTKK